MNAGRIVILVVVVLIATMGGLFWLQNSSTLVDVVFRLPLLGAWHLAQGMSLPVLLVISSGSGFVVGAGLFGLRSMSRGRKAKQLARQIESLQEEIDFARRGSSRPAGASHDAVL